MLQGGCEVALPELRMNQVAEPNVKALQLTCLTLPNELAQVRGFMAQLQRDQPFM